MSAPIAIREVAQLLRDLQRADSKLFSAQMQELDAVMLAHLLSCWQTMARPSQLRPVDSKPIWLRMAGRGEGKTRSAAEETLDICEDWGPIARVILCSKTIGDVRKVMIQGESGLEACARRRGYEVKYVSSHAMVYHPSGAQMYLTTSEKPDVPRGLQCNYAWCDEISSWMNPLETFNNIMFAWRLDCPGGPKMIITTTPKPNEIMMKLVKDPALSKRITITHGRTQDNRDNLAPGIVELFESVYAGTRLGLQEMEGQLLDHLGLTFHQEIIHQYRVRSHPDLARRVVALDPSIEDKIDSDEAGIVVVGCDFGSDVTREAYVLADRTIGQATFSKWARETVQAFIDFDCHEVIAEVNQGGSGIREAIQVAAHDFSRRYNRTILVPVKSVWAKESKKARAEPVGALYERGRVHHVGIFPRLEAEQTSWLPGSKSPNRMDALVYGVSALLLGDKSKVGHISGYWL